MGPAELNDVEIFRILETNQTTAAIEAGGYREIESNPISGLLFVRHYCYLMGLTTLRRLRAIELQVKALEASKKMM
jgi:hypothetical protein